MDKYITGSLIKELRENKEMTQQELAEKINVSSKTISKWETGNGFPDICILEDLAKALEISVSELFIGDKLENKNTSSNMLKTGFYICPICGNVIASTGDAFISCHGITLIKEEPVLKEVEIESIEDEVYITIDSPMTKDNYISFIAGIYSDSICINKLYPEQTPDTRLKRRGLRKFYYYSNREGLFYSNIKK